MKLVKPIAHGLYHNISRHWLLMPLGVDTDTHISMHEPKQFQETRHMRPSPGLKRNEIPTKTPMVQNKLQPRI